MPVVRHHLPRPNHAAGTLTQPCGRHHCLKFDRCQGWCDSPPEMLRIDRSTGLEVPFSVGCNNSFHVFPPLSTSCGRAARIVLGFHSRPILPQDHPLAVGIALMPSFESYLTAGSQ